jgi:hypothetical protein
MSVSWQYNEGKKTINECRAVGEMKIDKGRQSVPPFPTRPPRFP